MHDGSKLLPKKVAEDYDPTDKMTALRLLHETARRGEFATGILYIEPDKDDFLSMLDIVDEPLASLPLERVRPRQGRARRDHGVIAVVVPGFRSLRGSEVHWLRCGGPPGLAEPRSRAQPR